ncbi:hypothetical protein LXL04_003606 [Taraxacum kok-saghyz]
MKGNFDKGYLMDLILATSDHNQYYEFTFDFVKYDPESTATTVHFDKNNNILMIDRPSARKLNELMTQSDLVEYAMGGRKFTYMIDQGEKLSKIDRMLLKDAEMGEVRTSKQWVNDIEKIVVSRPLSSVELENRNTDPTAIKNEILHFFSAKFNEEMVPRPSLTCNFNHSLYVSDASFLIGPFSSSEIKAIIWGCGNGCASGTDGFSFNFIKCLWSCFEADFFNIVQHFHATGVINTTCNSSFITLVPKTFNPLSLADYRPINLIGYIYKVISKVLANRLRVVIGSVVGEVQPAFIAGKNILDGALMINELVSWLKQ